MSVKVVFFDVAANDKSTISRALKGYKDLELEFYSEPLSHDNWQLAQGAEVVSIYITSQIDKDILKNLKKLKFISVRATGFNNVDIENAKKHSVLVANVPGYGETTVAEYAFGLMLALMRKLFVAQAQLNTNQIDHSKLTGMDLAGKTLGIVGTGKIGGHMAQIAHGFGMYLVGYDIYENAELSQKFGLKYLKLNDLLRAADIVTLHAPATKQNFHMLGKKEFELMKRGSMVINTARGDLIDTRALVEVLVSKHLGGAALDVIEGEELNDIDEETALLQPHPPIKYLNFALEHLMLEKMPNVILSPHNAFNTHEALDKIRQISCQNILDYLNGQTHNVVDV